MNNEHLAVILREKAKEYGSQVAMCYKKCNEWCEITYTELSEKIQTGAATLLKLGIKNGEKIGIFSPNKPEWTITDFAAQSACAVAVPIYATNTAQQTEFIVKDADIRVIFTGNKEQYEKVMTFSDKISKLIKIVSFDESIKLWGNKSCYFSEFLKWGDSPKLIKRVNDNLDNAKITDLTTIIYTSGTTGNPKGVVLRHSNFIHQFRSLDSYFNIGQKDISLCFLPLSHVYERIWTFYILCRGAVNTYLENPRLIAEYLREVKPTVMVAVPRLYEKIYSAVMNKVAQSSAMKQKIFSWAKKVGIEYHYARKENKLIGPLLHSAYILADKMVLKKIRDAVGGHKNFFSAGGAALSKEIEEFFYAADLLVCQGYGLTETSPMVSCNRPGDYKFGTVGKPIEDCSVRISGEGEIQIKGSNVFEEYYNNPEATAEAFVDGWFKTGDVGYVDEDGYLHITDRIKDIIITSGGKNISPQHIEAVLGIDSYIEFIMAIGDGRKYISALIVPNFPVLEEYAKEKSISFASRDELINHPDIINFYIDRLEKRSAELANYEKVRKFTLLAKEFSQDTGELTPSLKVKRKFVNEKYCDIIDMMY